MATREEVRQFLAEADGRFERWTPDEEPATESHDDQEALRALPALQEAVLAYRKGYCGDEAVVDVRWRRLPNGREERRKRVVSCLAELAQPAVWRAPALPELEPTWVVDGGLGIE